MRKQDISRIHRYEYRIKAEAYRGTLKYTVYLDGAKKYAVQMPLRLLDTFRDEPVRRFERAMLGLEEGKPGKDVGSYGQDSGGLLRKAWGKLAGKPLDLLAQLFDVCPEEFLLDGEPSTAVKVVCSRPDGDKHAEVRVGLLDEAQVLELVKDELDSPGSGLKAPGDLLVVNFTIRTASGDKASKNLVFQGWSNFGIEHDH